MTQDLSLTPPVDRPDLRHRSVLFEVVKSIGVGAIAGVAFTTIGATLRFLTGGPKGFMNNLSHRMFTNVGSWGTIFGAMGFIGAGTVNRERDAARPYVEKLESERAGLINTVVKNNSR